jgi:hypothetical protein
MFSLFFPPHHRPDSPPTNSMQRQLRALVAVAGNRLTTKGLERNCKGTGKPQTEPQTGPFSSSNGNCVQCEEPVISFDCTRFKPVASQDLFEPKWTAYLNAEQTPSLNPWMGHWDNSRSSKLRVYLRIEPNQNKSLSEQEAENSVGE